MNFAPPPRNVFPAFIQTYFERGRQRAPRIEANAGKWTLEDLIPGLSDFDTRFLVNDAMTAPDWCAMSLAVGQVHLELARERKDWARNLEHLPGVNLKWRELFDPAAYFTEFSQWSFYHGPNLDRARQYVRERPWTAMDAEYHWKKIALYYGPYNRAIDPAINLGPYENKYPLHSRLLHYLAPPVHAGVCLLRQRSTPGKLEALRAARDLFPHRETMELALALIERHYAAPRYLVEPGLTELDQQLEGYLTGMVNTLRETGAPLDCPRNVTPQQLQAAVKTLHAAPLAVQLFENLKFARLMKGRLWFYGQEVLWFESRPLIRNELNRLRRNFYETPLRLFAKLAYGQDVSPEEALQRMTGDVFDPSEAAACRRFAELARPECPPGELKPRALAIAAVFDPFLCAMEKLCVGHGG